LTKFVLDTNVVVEPGRPTPDANVVRWLALVDESDLYLSAFSFAELRKGITRLGNTPRAAAFETAMLEFRTRFAGRILPVDDDVLDLWGRVTGAALVIGRPLPDVDAIFAATALHHGMTLVTRNERHMKTTGVMLLNPWTAQTPTG